MKIRRGDFTRWMVMGILGLVGSGAAVQAFAKDYIVKFKNADEARLAAASEMFQGASVKEFHEPGALLRLDLGNLSSQDEATRVAELMAQADVEYVVENVPMYAFSTPNDPKFAEQWALSKVEASVA